MHQILIEFNTAYSCFQHLEWRQKDGICTTVSLFLLHSNHLPSKSKSIMNSNESTLLYSSKDSRQLQSLLVDSSQNSKSVLSDYVTAKSFLTSAPYINSSATKQQPENIELSSLIRDGQASIQPMFAIMTDKNEQKMFFAQLQIYYESNSAGISDNLI